VHTLQLRYSGMREFTYTSEDPTWSNAYLWPPLLKVLRRVAPAPRRVFELGCGNGATARLLGAKGYDVTAVDPSRSGIELAKRNETASVRFAIGSTGDDLAGTFGTFPLVVSLEVIEHCPSSRDYMRCVRSLLEPGGIALISTPYHGYLKNLAVVASGNFDHHFDPLWEGGHLKFFTHAKLRTLFEEFGFVRVELHRVGRLPPLAKSTLAIAYRSEDAGIE